jgi:NitT/TauT family transport system substrate-binding protein
MRLASKLTALTLPLSLALAAVAPLVHSSVAAAADKPAATAATKLKLALNWKPEPQFGGFYAAAETGAFAKRNLTVEILEGGAGTPTVQMIAAGTVDFGVVSADEIVISRARGSDVVGIFAVYQTNPQGIMTRESRGLKSIADVYASPGTLAVQKGLAYVLFLEKKFPKPKVKIVPYQGGITNYLADETFAQQCFVTSEPLLADAAGKKPRTFLVADEGYNPYTTVVAVRESFLRKNEATVKAVVAAVREGWQSYLVDPAPTNKVMAKLNPSMDAKTFEASAQAQRPLIETAETAKEGSGGLGSMTAARWATLAEQLKTLKFIDKTPATDSLFRNL